jgi:hypothetical protein
MAAAKIVARTVDSILWNKSSYYPCALDSEICMRLVTRLEFVLSFLIELYEPSPRWGKHAFCGTELSGPWKPLGTLWKDFSSIFPFFQLGAGRKLAENRFRTHRLFVISRLTVSRFRNLSPVLSPLWKADCDCSSESLTPAMGTLWR